jgi:hypothetical protein
MTGVEVIRCATCPRKFLSYGEKICSICKGEICPPKKP